MTDHPVSGMRPQPFDVEKARADFDAKELARLYRREHQLVQALKKVRRQAVATYETPQRVAEEAKRLPATACPDDRSEEYQSGLTYREWAHIDALIAEKP